MSQYIYEHILASSYHWTLDYIRSLDLQDFYPHLKMCMVRDALEKEFQARLAGALVGDENVEGKPQITESHKLKSGAVRSTQSESIHIRKKIGELKMNKRTGEVVSFNQDIDD